jgi:hypothetical protein
MIQLLLAACAVAQDPSPDPFSVPPDDEPAYESRFETRTTAREERVTGAPGSTLNEGAHVVSENRWLSTWRSKGGETLEFEANGRWTDDERNDPNRWSLLRMAVTYTSKETKVVGGDFAASFSPLALSASLRGVQAETRWNGARFVLLGGTNKPDWRSQFEKVENEPADRIFFGARIEAEPEEMLRIGLSAVHAKDALGTADVKLGLLGHRNILAAADAEWTPFDELTLRGEAAWSDYDTDIDSPSGTEVGRAYRGEGTWRPDPFEFAFGYERVDPDFLTAGGSAIPDRESARGRVVWIPSRVVELQAGLVRFRDNLDGQLPETTRTDEPDAGVRFPDLFGVAGLQLRGSHRLTRTRSDSGLKDSDVRTTEGALEMLVAGVTGGVVFSLRKSDDRSPSDSDAETETWTVSAGIPLDWLARSGALGLRAGRERTRDLAAGKEHETDTVSAAVTAQLHERVSIALGWEWAERRPDNFPDDDQVNRVVHAQLEYAFGAPAEATITLSFERRDYGFEGAGAVNDYRETIWLLALWWAR